MSERVAQLKDQLNDAIAAGDDDKVQEIEQMMFLEFGYDSKTGRKKKAGGGRMKMQKGGFPDLTGDGKVTRADILKGRGVKLASGGEAVMDATSNRATNAGISRGGGAALRGTKFRGVK